MDESILITGDVFLGAEGTREEAKLGDSKKLFGDMIPIIQGSKLAITNLESPVFDQDLKGIIKTGPLLKAPIQSLGVLKDAGFDLLTLGNNHILDYGFEGLASTLEACRQLGFGVVGAGVCVKTARTPYYTTLGKDRLTILNFAENEFSTLGPKPFGANPVDLANNFRDIREARSKSDLVLVIVHGGREYYNLPTPDFQKMLRFYVECGADAVVAHHTHIVSGYEIFLGKPIFYGLGNFHFNNFSNKKNRPGWNTGMAVKLFKNTDQGFGFNIIPFNQCLGTSVSVKILSEADSNIFMNDLIKINNIISNEEQLKDCWKRYLKTQKKAYETLLLVNNKLIRKFVNRGILPLELITNEVHRTHVVNLIRCETHREILLSALLEEK
jgi:poly-gamma-glutamate synthesis protein (capsule biosynthesis protein)